MTQNIVEVLAKRSFIHQVTDVDGLNHLARGRPVTAYIGFDLTAPSLHVGSLIQIMVLRWLIRTGNAAIILLGEATTQIGDPTGKDRSRPVLSAEEIETNRIGIQAVLDRLVGRLAFDLGQHVPVCVSNIEWFGGMGMLDYLREFGPHFSVNRMLTFDSVQERLTKKEHMSFTEFNYMLFQAIDFLKLSRDRRCDLQIGGSDQWGNIVNGVELIRRIDGKVAFGLTTPLLTNSAGEKMGKTVNGAIWLDAEKTSPFEFWQFWRNVEDAKVETFLRLFTEFDLDHIAGTMKLDINEAKMVLATAVTTIVHGAEEAGKAMGQAMSIFVDRNFDNGVEIHEIDPAVDKTIGEILVRVGFAKSKGDADRLAANGGVKVDNEVVSIVRDVLPRTKPSFILSVGKKRFVRISLGRAEQE